MERQGLLVSLSCDGAKAALGGAKTAPGARNATRGISRIKGWRLGYILNATRESKMEILDETR
jgi:hypothetical protein